MASVQGIVGTGDELLASMKDGAARQIVVRGTLSNVPSIRLSPGQSLRGEDERSSVDFISGSDGL
jgi:hypothetical protein